MRRNKTSRRELLKIGSVAAGTSVTGALAGCVGEVPLADGTSIGSYPNWLYEPGTGSDSDHYQFQLFQLSNITEYEDEFDDVMYDNITAIEQTYSYLDIDIEDMDTLLYFDGGVTVLTGSYVTEDVIEELKDEDYDEETDHEGYTIYLTADETTAVGVSDEAVLVTSNVYGEAAELVETVIDTELGDEDRYATENEAFSELTSVLNVGTSVSGRTHEPTESIGSIGDEGRSIAYGETVESSLSSDDSIGEYGNKYYELFDFVGSRNDAVTIEMEAASGDTYLILEGPDGTILAQNDDIGGSNYNSRIERTLNRTGGYTIVATSYDQSTFGYRLSLSSSSDASTETALGQFENEVARGSATTVNGDIASRTWAIVFASEDDVRIDDVEEWIDETESSGEQFDEYEDITTSEQGRTVLVEATIDTADLREF